MANVVKNAMQQKQLQAQHPAAQDAKSFVAAAAPVHSSPSAAAKAILNAALARAEHNAPAAKTDLSVPFAPLKVRPLSPATRSQTSFQKNVFF
jgi:hypothetical protein